MPDIPAMIITLMNQSKSSIKYPRTVTDAIYDIDSQKMLTSILSQVAITVDTIQERDSLPFSQRANGRLVRVNDDGKGNSAYYTWDTRNSVWNKENFSLEIGSIEDVPDIIKQSILWQNIK